jgi:hypothetical protein
LLETESEKPLPGAIIRTYVVQRGLNSGGDQVQYTSFNANVMESQQPKIGNSVAPVTSSREKVLIQNVDDANRFLLWKIRANRDDRRQDKFVLIFVCAESESSLRSKDLSDQSRWYA